MNKEKIVNIATSDMMLYGALLNQIKYFSDLGYESVAISASGPYLEALKVANIRHIPIPFTRRITPFSDLVCLYSLYRVLRRERFTIVHTHNPKTGFLGQLAARAAGVPFVVNTIHGFYFHDHMHPLKRWFYVQLEKIAAVCSDVIFAVSGEDVHTAITEKIATSGMIRHIGNGIDLARFDRSHTDPEILALKSRELGIPDGAPVVGFAGRLVAEKGILELLRASHLIVREIPTAHFLIVGPYDVEKTDVIDPVVARTLGVAGRCIMAGMRTDMPDMYALMDVFVLPSHREGFPRTLMEAAAMGVPCVATDIRGCREAIEHGRNGLLYPVGSIQGLADAVVQVLTDEERARKMGKEGRMMALERFDEKRIFRIVLGEYERLLKMKKLD